MRLLVLGGTMFVGRAIVEQALARGWRVTTFNRGVTASDVHGVEVVRGDRAAAADIRRLAEAGEWDAVVDTSAYVPRDTLTMANALADRVEHYTLASSVSVYSKWPREPLTEASDVLPCPADAGLDYGPDDVEDGPTRYGYLKSGCEAAVVEAFGPGRVTIMRPGVILGPGEYVGRLPWWLRRVALGGTVLAPGNPERPIQPIDVRDLATFALDVSQARLAGTYNLAAPVGHATFGELLRACIETTGSDAKPRWVPEAELLRLGVRQWSELPLWRTFDGVWRVDAQRAARAGLSCRPVSETVHDTWTWMAQAAVDLSNERAGEIGIAPEKERAVLAVTAVPAAGS